MNRLRLTLLCFLAFQVKDYLSRFANIPDILELDHLTVSGDVTFGKNVSLKVVHSFTFSVKLLFFQWY